MAYLYEVGSGKTYSTISSALDQVYTDWGSTPFDGTVEVRVYDGSYTESIDPASSLAPTREFKLLIAAADGNAPTVNGQLTTYGGPWNVHLRGMEIGYTGGGPVLRMDKQGHIIEGCTVTAAASWGQLDVLQGGVLVVDSTFDGEDAGNHSNIRVIASYGITVIRRCTLKDAAINAMQITGTAGTVIMEACELWNDGSDPLIRLAASGDFRGGLFLHNNSFLGGTKVLEADADVQLAFRAVNNICRNQSTGAFDISGGVDHDEITIEANDYSNCGYFVKDADGTYTDLAEIQAAGYDVFEKSLTVDPKFTSETDGSEDLTLQAASTLPNKGIGAGVSEDRSGTVAPCPQQPAIGADFQRDVAPSVPGIPAITAVSVSGTAVTATLDGDAGVANWVQLRRASTGAVEDEQSRSGDGDVELDAPETGAAYALVPYSQSGDYRSKPGSPWPLYVSGGVTAGEMASAIVSRLASASAVTDRLASAGSIYRRRPPRAAEYPCITYDLAASPDPEAAGLGKLAGTLALELWGFDRGLLDELLEAVDGALAGERISTDNWEIKHLARASSEAGAADMISPAMGTALERLCARWELRAYRKGA